MVGKGKHGALYAVALGCPYRLVYELLVSLVYSVEIPRATAQGCMSFISSKELKIFK